MTLFPRRLSWRRGSRRKTRPARALRLGCLLIVGSILAACGGADPVYVCPPLVILRDTDKQVKFVGSGRDLTDVEFEALMREPVLACGYDDGAIDGLLTATFLAARGPADDDRLARIGYFVAVADETDQIISREEFAFVVPFEGNQTQVSAFEEVDVRIPLKAGETGELYKVYIGMRLTPDQLRYNQENR